VKDRNNMPTIMTLDARAENTNTPSEILGLVCTYEHTCGGRRCALAEFLRQKLGKSGSRTNCVNGRRTLRLAAEQPFDMVLLDLNLNGATAWTCFAAFG